MTDRCWAYREHRLAAGAGWLLGAWCGWAALGGALAPGVQPPEALQRLSDIPGVALESAAGAASIQDDPEALKLYEEAREQLEAQQPTKALARLDAALAVARADYYELHHLRAQVYEQLSRFGEARAAAENAARLRPGGAEIHSMLGRLYEKLGNPQRAVAHYRTATLAAERELTSPQVTLAWHALGRLLAQQGQFLAAAEAWARFDEAVFGTHTEQRHAEGIREILELEPLGMIERRLELLHRAGLGVEALRAAQEAVQSRPDDVHLARLYVRELLDAGQSARAWTFIRERLDDPQQAPALLSAAIPAARQAGRLEAWVEQISDAVRRGEHLELARRLAGRLREAGAAEQAVILLGALVEAQPEDPEVALELALARRAAGDVRGGVLDLACVVRTRSQQTVELGRRLEDWLDQGGSAAAFLESSAELSASPQRDWALDLALALTAAAVRELPLAEELLGSCLRDQPDCALAEVAWGLMLARECRWDGALEHARRALELDGHLPAAHYLLGIVHAGRDDNEAAIESLRQALRLDAQPRTALALGRLLQRAGDRLAAQRFFQQAFTLDPGHAAALEELIDSYVADGKFQIAGEQLRAALDADAPADALRRASTTLRFAGRLFQEEHLAELARQFEVHPEDVRTGLKLAEGLYFQRRPAEGWAVVEKLLAVAPQDEDVLILAAQGWMQRLEHAQAIRCLEALLKRFPNRQRLLLLTAEAYLNDFRLEEARATLMHLLALDVDERVRERLRDEILHTLVDYVPADYDAALELLKTWIAENPGQETLELRRVQVLSAAGRHEQAIELAQRLLDASPRAGRRREAFLEACVEAGALQRAADQVREWLEDEPGDPGLIEVLVRILIRQHQADEALELLRRYQPQSWSAAIAARRLLAQVQAARGRTEDALSELDALLEERLVSENATHRALIRNQILSVLDEAGWYDRAVERCDRWLQETDQRDLAARWAILLAKVDALQNAGRMDEYVATLEELIRMQPHSPVANNNLGYTWIERGVQLQRATEMVRQALAMDPRNPAYLDSLGWACYKAGDFGQARVHLERAVRLRAGQDPVVYEHLGDAQYRLGDSSAARASWQKALEMIEDPSRRPEGTQRAELTARLRAKLEALEKGQPPELAPTAGEQEP